MTMANLVIIIFVSFILFGYSFHFSFAKTSNEKEEYDKKYNKLTELSIDKNETSKNKLKESNILNNNTNALNNIYPDDYYVCGYPKQLITDYSFLEKLDCD